MKIEDKKHLKEIMQIVKDVTKEEFPSVDTATIESEVLKQSVRIYLYEKYHQDN